MTITLDQASFTAQTRAIASRAEALSERRKEIEHDVEQLLASWRGAAADRFTEAWQEWRDGADGVVASLMARTDALTATRDDLAATDDRTAAESARLRGRLG